MVNQNCFWDIEHYRPDEPPGVMPGQLSSLTGLCHARRNTCGWWMCHVCDSSQAMSFCLPLHIFASSMFMLNILNRPSLIALESAVVLELSWLSMVFHIFHHFSIDIFALLVYMGWISKAFVRLWTDNGSLKSPRNAASAAALLPHGVVSPPQPPAGPAWRARRLGTCSTWTSAGKASNVSKLLISNSR